MKILELIEKLDAIRYTANLYYEDTYGQSNFEIKVIGKLAEIYDVNSIEKIEADYPERIVYLHIKSIP
ncbi:MAG: hypothetical protein ABIO44_03705 [Saprospiraceae bacterium]